MEEYYTLFQKTIAIYQAGHSQKKVAEILGIPEYKVRKYTKQYGYHNGLKSDSTMYNNKGREYYTCPIEIEIPICPIKYL
ncbi:hypothetical protein [Clostridium thermobutyricum]|uniref:Uncharacterized protein n=1 Tax=Clostridium thermobutyricum DSM 4928 TaxID=1121339 RepID=A0A1V4SV23_9CLOT|nr:hypothetical protein [Clostridium thermobutyricum]OPX47853.1 hypothetical protein CLTHE_14240 [Clostridium thermobutyricum DSM 4928]